MFLPTMPQDDLEEVKEALLAGRARDPGENPVFYSKYCFFVFKRKVEIKEKQLLCDFVDYFLKNMLLACCK